MRETINISAPVAALCELLGLDAENVRHLALYPRSVTAEVYRLNADGKKFIDDETNEAAFDVVSFPTTTLVA
jgi:hypothetical protein